MKLSRKLGVYIVAFMGLIMLQPLGAKAADTITLPITGTYEQTSARAMLDKINAARTGADAWYWNEDNSQKVVVTNLQPLTYDYDLEQAAMKRAMEISVSFSHTRPNGSSCFTAFSGNWKGENIAYGYPNADSVFEGWMETNEPYDGQGHRRNILSGEFTAVGIGHVVRNDYDFWVQDFRSPTGSTTVTTVTNEDKVVQVEILKNGITSTLEFRDLDYSNGIYVGETIDLSEFCEVVYYNSNFYAFGIPIRDTAYTITNDSPATISNGKLTATGAGTIKFEATSSVTGQRISSTLTVKKKDLSRSAMVSVNPSIASYTGQEVKPSVTVTVGGATLTEGVDYTLSFENNVSIGTAQAVVTGIGNYTGTKKSSFLIRGKSVTDATITLSPKSFVYDGTSKCPGVTVVIDNVTLTQGTDYTVEYTNNVNVGCGYVKVTGAGNYTGWVKLSFTIREKGSANEDDSTCDVYDDEDGGMSCRGAVYEVTKKGEVSYRLTDSKKKTVTIPNYFTFNGTPYEVTSIKAGGFENNKTIKNVTISSSIKTIGKNAFKGCSQLKKIRIYGDSLKTVKTGAFKGINKKAKIEICVSSRKKYDSLVKKIRKAGAKKVSFTYRQTGFFCRK